MSTSKGYVDTDYLELAARLTRPAKDGSYGAMHLQPGQRVLDVGCGPGTDTLTLATLLGDDGRVVGIDFDPEMIATANEHAREAGLAVRVTHRVADALSLPFIDDEFDATRSERLFEHLLQPEKALAEMVRVTKPGGWVVVLDTDWGTASMHSTYIDIERKLTRLLAEQRLNNGFSGRRLYGQFKKQGLQEITIGTFMLFTTDYGFARLIATLDESEAQAIRSGIITEDECNAWKADLEKADEEGMFFTSVGMVLLAGRKPA
jgi:ubiquinone/menaquinone biosynthesis C-methylase UbiE